MTDSLDRLATPTRPSDWLALVADPSVDRLARTDERTNEATTHQPAASLSIATPAGGHTDSASDDDLTGAKHDHSPHVYIVYWPDIATIKVGITTTQERWEWWTRRGAVLIATTHTCCDGHARKIERRMLDRVAQYGARAFKSEQDARFALGKKRGGYTECYRLVQSPRFGEPPEGDYDYERAYGLILPREIEDDFGTYNFGPYPITNAWRTA